MGVELVLLEATTHWYMARGCGHLAVLCSCHVLVVSLPLAAVGLNVQDSCVCGGCKGLQLCVLWRPSDGAAVIQHTAGKQCCSTQPHWLQVILHLTCGTCPPAAPPPHMCN